jgi:hypothetical protein
VRLAPSAMQILRRLFIRAPSRGRPRG